MKVEPRGKYAGVKVHLDAEECQAVLAFVEYMREMFGKGLGEEPLSWEERFGVDLGRKIECLMQEQPNLLTDRTPAQIAAALEKEEVSARLKKEVLAKGQDWKKIKVKVEVEK